MKIQASEAHLAHEVSQRFALAAAFDQGVQRGALPRRREMLSHVISEELGLELGRADSRPAQLIERIAQE